MTTNFQPPPTYADPVIVDEATRKGQFNPIWLKWFLDLSQFINNNGGGGTIQHNTLGGLQGGTTGQYYHLNQATYQILNNIGTPTAGSVAYGNGSTLGFSAAGVVGQVLTSNGAAPPIWSTPSGGTVTSVGLAMPTQFAVTNSPVTGSGTLTAAWNSQTANSVLAGPTTGAAAAPTFRALVAADIPALSYAPLTSGTAILYGNGSGGFSSVTIGTGVSFVGGVLSATGSGGTVTSVTASSPISSSGGTTPNISISQASSTTNGYLSSTDWNTFNNKQPAGTYVTSVTGTSPVVSSGGTTPAISLASGYGDTQNPYASKTANYFLAAPNGSAGAPTFRAMVAADVPALSYVSSVSGTTGRITSTGGLTPVIDLASGVATPGTTGSSTLIPVVTIDTYGRVTSITTAANPQGTVTAVSVVSANGFAGTSSGGATPALTLSTSITGLLYGNGTALAATTVSAPLTYSAGTLAITQATTSTNGYLSSTDWNTFNNKQPAGTYVTSVTGTSPVVSSGGTTPAISLASGYGDTQNPYASKTANYVLAAPNGSAGAPTFRALVAADIPSLPYQPTAAPVTYTANFSVATTDVWIINNKSGSSCTATLPTASSYSGRVLRFQNYQAQTLVSASSNVVPIVGGAAGTAILNAVAGDTCTLVSDGTNWVMTQYVPNNILLLE